MKIEASLNKPTRPPFIAHRLSPTVYRPPFIAHRLSHRLSHRLLLSVYRPLFITLRLSPTVYHSPFIAHRLSPNLLFDGTILYLLAFYQLLGRETTGLPSRRCFGLH